MLKFALKKYYRKPKDMYKFDNFLNKIPYENVRHIYEGSDIYWLDSFINSSLEMMAKDEYSIAFPNGNSREFLKNWW